MQKYKYFDDNEVRGKLRKLKNADLPNEYKKLLDSYNEHQIDRRQFDKLKSSLMVKAKEARAAILAERNQLINKAEVSYLNELAGSGKDVDRFVQTYDQVNKFDSDKLASEYEKRLKVGDETGQRACAFASAEKMINRVVNDYKGRNPGWAETAEEYRSFHKNIASKDAKMKAGFGDPDFQIMEPQVKTKTVQFGYVLAGSERRPHYVERLELK